MTDGVNASMLEFLSWIATRPRTFDEAAAAWQSTCPRHTIWEDAFIEGLVKTETRRGNRCEVILTARAEAILENFNGKAPAARVAVG